MTTAMVRNEYAPYACFFFKNTAAAAGRGTRKKSEPKSTSSKELFIAIVADTPRQYPPVNNKLTIKDKIKNVCAKHRAPKK
jgi:hypothetical protein